MGSLNRPSTPEASVVESGTSNDRDDFSLLADE
jgi:hypothetical protein